MSELDLFLYFGLNSESFDQTKRSQIRALLVLVREEYENICGRWFVLNRVNNVVFSERKTFEYNYINKSSSNFRYGFNDSYKIRFRRRTFFNDCLTINSLKINDNTIDSSAYTIYDGRIILESNVLTSYNYGSHPDELELSGEFGYLTEEHDVILAVRHAIFDIVAYRANLYTQFNFMGADGGVAFDDFRKRTEKAEKTILSYRNS